VASTSENTYPTSYSLRTKGCVIFHKIIVGTSDGTRLCFYTLKRRVHLHSKGGLG